MKAKQKIAFKRIAHEISQLSNDDKLKVGCVIVDEFGENLVYGYNGDEIGGTNERESIESGKSGFLHAEENALLKLNYSQPTKYVFLTHSPCKMCMKRLINAKVNAIFYSTVYSQEDIDWFINHPVGKDIPLIQM